MRICSHSCGNTGNWNAHAILRVLSVTSLSLGRRGTWSPARLTRVYCWNSELRTELLVGLKRTSCSREALHSGSWWACHCSLHSQNTVAPKLAEYAYSNDAISVVHDAGTHLTRAQRTQEQNQGPCSGPTQACVDGSLDRMAVRKAKPAIFKSLRQEKTSQKQTTRTGDWAHEVVIP